MGMLRLFPRGLVATFLRPVAATLGGGGVAPSAINGALVALKFGVVYDTQISYTRV